MKHFINFRRGAALAALLVPVLVGCEKEFDDYYTEVGAQLPTFLSNDFGTATKYATGEVVRLELRFAQQTDPVKEIRILQKIEPNRDSTLVQTIPYQPAFSRIRNADTLLVNYTVPAGVNKANVRVDAVVVSTNDQSKTRTFSFRLAEATPIIRVNNSSNVTAPGTSIPAPGDVVRYNLTLNAGGINAATSLTTTGTLYKDLDSLITYVRVGTAAERRLPNNSGAIRRLPASGAQTGAATTVDVDVTLPPASSGQAIVYRFEAKSRFLGTPNVRTGSVTAAAITPATPTALAPTRNVSLTYTGANGGDQAALDLTTFATVAASGPLASKDLAITSIAGNAVRIQALNPTTGTPAPPPPTRFVRLAAASSAAAFTGATLNSIRQAYLTATAANQVTQLDNLVVGDVVVARIRGNDQYAILNVTGINRTAAEATVTFAVKAL